MSQSHIYLLATLRRSLIFGRDLLNLGIDANEHSVVTFDSDGDLWMERNSSRASWRRAALAWRWRLQILRSRCARLAMVGGHLEVEIGGCDIHGLALRRVPFRLGSGDVRKNRHTNSNRGGLFVAGV